MPGVSTGKSAAGPDLSSTCAEPEMAYHKSKELREISRPEKEIFTYVDFLADFRGTFHDICNDTRFGHCLDRNSYGASQHLARELLEGGSAGVVYPSVRQPTTPAAGPLRPALRGRMLPVVTAIVLNSGAKILTTSVLRLQELAINSLKDGLLFLTEGNDAGDLETALSVS